MYYIIKNAEDSRYFIADTETRTAGQTWRPSVQEAINHFKQDVISNHPIFSFIDNDTFHEIDHYYTFVTKIKSLTNIKDEYPELLI